MHRSWLLSSIEEFWQKHNRGTSGVTTAFSYCQYCQRHIPQVRCTLLSCIFIFHFLHANISNVCLAGTDLTKDPDASSTAVMKLQETGRLILQFFFKLGMVKAAELRAVSPTLSTYSYCLPANTQYGIIHLI